MPRDRSPDSTIVLLREGYTFISNRCRRMNTPVFQTRIQLQKTLCMMGEEAARLFYDETRFTRTAAAPSRLKATLVGRGAVQSLNGPAHRHRKRMFMSLMSPDSLRRLAELTAAQWQASLNRWERRDEVVLLTEVEELLFRAVAEWCGVPVHPSQVSRRTRDLAALIDSPARLGPRHWRGRFARARAEAWLAKLVHNTRTGKLRVQEGTALHAFAMHRELNGKPLGRRLAAVELLNVMRPTVAIARYIVFAAHAMHEHPECRDMLQRGDPEYLEMFVQEVRRFYPFFPSAMARVRETFEWKGFNFPKGARVLLDLYGTTHDARIWEQPEAFRPERFRGWEGNPYTLIPQGGGDHFSQHRCAGEWLTIELMKQAVAFLARSMTYEVPEQDLEIRLSRMPALPNSRFIVRQVRRMQAAEAMDFPEVSRGVSFASASSEAHLM